MELEIFVADDWDARKEVVPKQLEDNARARSDRELGSDDVTIPTACYSNVIKTKWNDLQIRLRNNTEDKANKIKAAQSEMNALREADGEYAKDPQYIKASNAFKAATEQKARASQDGVEHKREHELAHRALRTVHHGTNGWRRLARRLTRRTMNLATCSFSTGTRRHTRRR